MTDVSAEDLENLLNYFSKNTYSAKDADETCQRVMQRCILLSDIDYTYSTINNSTGDFSTHYPAQLIILQNEKFRNLSGNTKSPHTNTKETIYENMFDLNKLMDLIKNAKIARCRSRFPLPVILYKGRYICRSSTLAGGPEIYSRSGIDYFFPDSDSSSLQMNSNEKEKTKVSRKKLGFADWQLFDKVRRQDIELLKTFNVGIIADLMVEKKKVKFGLNVTSSEKVDKEKRYSHFTLLSLPYPGCEFFREFRDNDYDAHGLIFDWSQSYIDTHIKVPEDPITNQLKIKWHLYQLWDLIQLTQNYLILLLRYLCDNNNSGILVHCISGWDRTPLFISLLRISLWADGVIHSSLDAYQLIYYTISYDWMLFGHDFVNRYVKGEEIFLFCFYFLKFITDDKFNVHIYDEKFNMRHKSRQNCSRNDSEIQLDNIVFENERSTTPMSTTSLTSSHSSNQDPPALFSPEDDMPVGNISQSSSSSSSKESALCDLPSFVPLGMAKFVPPSVPIPIPCHTYHNLRSETNSSNDSWQIISAAGSLRGSTQFADMESSTDSNKVPFANIAEDEASCRLSRKDKLEEVRNIFYHIYSKHIGFRFKDNSEPNALGQIIGNFAEKVRTVSTQPL